AGSPPAPTAMKTSASCNRRTTVKVCRERALQSRLRAICPELRASGPTGHAAHKTPTFGPSGSLTYLLRGHLFLCNSYDAPAPRWVFDESIFAKRNLKVMRRLSACVAIVRLHHAVGCSLP